MTKRFLITGALLALGTFLAGWSPYRTDAAEEKKAEPAKSKDQKSAAAVAAIGAAYQMADLGRATKSPEMLLGAAKVLLSISARPGDVVPTTEKGEQIKSGEPESLKAVAARWLKEAVAMAPDDRAVSELARRLLDQESQGSLGGPRSYYHRPGAGEVITWNVEFVAGRPACVSVAGNGRNVLTLSVTGPRGGSFVNSGVNPHLNWVPPQTQIMTITVRNDGPGAAAYTLYHN